MAKKTQTVFVCNECGYESPKWMGQCICGSWNSMTEEKLALGDRQSEKSPRQIYYPTLINEIQSSEKDRLDTGMKELNRVLGGGLVKGSLTLISGEPGIGKSTLILQVAGEIAQKYGAVLYVSGEESEEQIKLRAERIGVESHRLYILTETQIEQIIERIKELSPDFVIIDSIQTLFSDELTSVAGSVSQVKVCCDAIMRLAKSLGIPVFLVAHVTKSGELAGPKIIEHMVDTVLHFSGERDHDFRILRSYKNRFGTTSEIGAFEMSETGLIQLENLSENFLQEAAYGAQGAMVTAVYEGTRPLLFEVQALVVPTAIGFSRRNALGIDTGRLNMMVAVLEKKVGLTLINQDIYVNVTGGMRPEGTSTDLAVALSIYSAASGNFEKSGKAIAIGEIGLTGELRSVRQIEYIVKEAERLGFEKIIMPKRNAQKIQDNTKLAVLGAKNLSEAIELCYEK